MAKRKNVTLNGKIKLIKINKHHYRFTMEIPLNQWCLNVDKGKNAKEYTEKRHRIK